MVRGNLSSGSIFFKKNRTSGNDYQKSNGYFQQAKRRMIAALGIHNFCILLTGFHSGFLKALKFFSKT